MFHAIASSQILCATSRVGPSPSREVKPSQGIVWPGSLLTPLTSPPPSLREGLGKPQGRKTKSQNRTRFRRPLPKPPLTNLGRKGRGKPGLRLGGFLRGQRRPVLEEDGHLNRSLRIEKALPETGASSGPGFRPSVRCGPQFPALGVPAAAVHRPPA